jgi:hypothetical protein
MGYFEGQNERWHTKGPQCFVLGLNDKKFLYHSVYLENVAYKSGWKLIALKLDSHQGRVRIILFHFNALV